MFEPDLKSQATAVIPKPRAVASVLIKMTCNDGDADINQESELFYAPGLI